MRFQNRCGIITGASKGIGLATARALARHQVDLALFDIDEEGLFRSKVEFLSLGIRVFEYLCDIGNEEDVKHAVAEAQKDLGKIDILVNNAGIYREHRIPFIDSRSDYWREKIAINVLGTMYITYAVLPGMLERGYGRIVNVSSVAGVYGLQNNVDYSASKGAVIAFTRALAREITSNNVIVNAVSPGTIGETLDPANFNYLGRSGTYEECAEVICFLASDNASYVAGQNVIVDGCRKKI